MRGAVSEAGLKPGGSELGIGAGDRKAELLGLTALTVYIEVHDALGHAVGIGGYAAVGTMVAGPGAHDGDDGAVGAYMNIVCRVGIEEGMVSEGVLMPWCCQQVHFCPTSPISQAWVCPAHRVTDSR